MTAKRNRKGDSAPVGRQGQPVAPTVGLRIIGGSFRGRKLEYSGDLRTRPMKDRLREAVFNLLGSTIRDKHAVDLFAGTGALALEAISRGASSATLIELHQPTARIIRQNAATLGIESRVDIVPGNVFIWWHKHLAGNAALPADRPWAVFCSPPYDFYVDRSGEMLELLNGMVRAAPATSLFVVEADGRFDFGSLPDPEAWDVRQYLPAVVGIYCTE
jgi:16S rRNA (guanine966-N2)-methyltransferase